MHGAKARVARASRIYVEGRHDAELVERVWGDDLRIEGVVVEYLGGVDDLAGHLREFRPGPDRRVGVLVDHLVAGSKESRIADEVSRSPLGAHVLVVGHPFVDVWQAVKPDRIGLSAWPEIPRSVEWKKGVCAHLGWPHASQADIARAWQHILAQVQSYDDLEPALLGRVEELIDFVDRLRLRLAPQDVAPGVLGVVVDEHQDAVDQDPDVGQPAGEHRRHRLPDAGGRVADVVAADAERQQDLQQAGHDLGLVGVGDAGRAGPGRTAPASSRRRRRAACRAV